MMKNKLMILLLTTSITLGIVSLLVSLPHVLSADQIATGVSALLVAVMFYLVYQIVDSMLKSTTPVSAVVNEEVAVEVPTMKAEPMPKRKRRTKAEIERANNTLQDIPTPDEFKAPKKKGPKSKK